MNMKGCYDTEAHYAYYINEALKDSGYNFSYDNEAILRRKKFVLLTSSVNVKYIIVRDLKLSYILGIDYNNIGKKLYFKRNDAEEPNGTLEFEKKMYILLHHELNVYCTQMLAPNFTGY
jgi:hypothetical protein